MHLNTTFLADRDAWIIRLCSGKKVLHLGCTDWPLTAERLRNNRLLHGHLAQCCENVVGVDVDAEGIEILRGLMPAHEFHVASCEGLDKSDHIRGREWDIILAADVFEHVSNLGLALVATKQLMSSQTRLVITLPSAFSAKRFFTAALTGREHVHPDHCYYFSPSTILQCLARAGLTAESLGMFMWRNPSFINRLAAALLKPLNMVTGGRLADELALVAQRKEEMPRP